MSSQVQNHISSINPITFLFIFLPGNAPMSGFHGRRHFLGSLWKWLACVHTRSKMKTVDLRSQHSLWSRTAPCLSHSWRGLWRYNLQWSRRHSLWSCTRKCGHPPNSSRGLRTSFHQSLQQNFRGKNKKLNCNQSVQGFMVQNDILNYFTTHWDFPNLYPMSDHPLLCWW